MIVLQISTAFLMLAILTGSHAHDMKNTSKLISEERRLYHYLMDDYDPAIRPHLNGTTTHVKFGVTFNKLLGLDEKDHTMQAKGWVYYEWTDPQLIWDPKDFGYVYSMNIPVQKLWIPDIELWNIASTDMDDVMMYTRALVFSSGMVIWVPQYVIHSSCPLDLRHFPYDTQKCSLMFGPWTYNSAEINITLRDTKFSGLDFDTYEEHNEWEITESNGTKKNFEYPGYEVKYNYLQFDITFKRKHHYYTAFFVVPAVIMALLSPVIFVLPSDNPEKTKLGAGILIAQTLLLLMLFTYIPSAHPVVPIIGIYYMTAVLLTAIQILAAAIVNNVWSRSQRKVSMPGLVRKIFLGKFSSICCISKDSYMVIENESGKQLDDLNENGESQSNTGDQIMMVNSYAKMEATEWKQLAAVLDRFFLWFFLLLICFISAIMGHT